MKIGIIAAMSKEREQVALMLGAKRETSHGGFSFIEGTIGKNEIVLMESGIGKVNAAVGTVAMINAYAPDCIINTGVAGGADKSLHVMDVVVGSRTAYHDVWCGEGNEIGQVQGLPAFYEGNRDLYSIATQLRTDVSIVGGLICTGDQFIQAPEKIAQIKSDFPEAYAVDMESAAMAQVCHIYNVPFISFRILSDIAGVENHTEMYNNFWGTIAEKSFAVTEAFLKALPEKLG